MSMCRNPLRPGLVLLSATLALAAAQPAVGQSYDTEFFDALRWRNIGIQRGGRSIGVGGSDSRPYEYYFGATGGGLWKTTDAGQTWRAVTDGKINSSSVGAVGVCEADPDVVYIGTGETELRGNVMQGDGIYRTANGGNTWAHLGLEETQNIARVRVHPTDCNTVWVAAFGKHSTENAERGVYKTTDGGETWRQVLYRDARSGAVDLTFDPGNPDVMYVALWEAWRKSWGMSSGGPGSGLFKSSDGGEHWTEISRNPGLPQEGLLGKIGVAVSPANPQRVWALIENDEGGVFRSDDGGATWERINEERKLRQRAFYYSRIYADPQDEDVVYALNTGMYRSKDGGKTFPESIRVPHGDNHDLWIAPSDPDRMINSNDGGANVSLNGGSTWTDQDFPTAQFYRVVTTHHQPYLVCGAQQDNSTACTAWKGWNHLSAGGGFGGGGHFFSVGGCESGYIAPDPKNTDVYFAGCYGGSLSRYDHATGDQRQVNVWPENPMGQSSIDLRERVQWTYPIVFSPVDPNILYTGTQKVWRSTTEGQSWQALSGDLTRAAEETLGPSGGPITKDQTGVETYGTIFAIAPSQHDVNVIWAGSDDGYVSVTRDGGATWTNVTPPDAPDFVRINTIEASPTTAGKAYVAGIRYLVDDDRSPYVWKTTDYGQTWTKIVEGIGANDFVRAVREDPTRPGLLYASSETTVYVSWDDGAHWSSLGLNLPNTQVSDIVVADNDLVVATHGRSFWVLPSIGPIRQMSDRIATASVHLFDPVDPVRGVDQGVDVYYYLAENADKVTIEFADSRGTVIQTFESAGEEPVEEQGPAQFFGGGRAPSPAKSKGSRRFTWNLRYPGYTDFEGRIFWAAGNQGPAAVPGEYVVRLSVDDHPVQEQRFEVRMDSRLEGKVALADLQKRFDLAIEIRDRVSEANQAVIDIRGVKSEVDDRLGQTDDRQIESVGGEVKSKLSGVEEEVYQVRNQSNQDPLNFPIKLNNKLAALMGVVESGESGPAEQQYEVYEYLSVQLDTQLRAMQLILREDLSRLNELLQRAGLEPIRVGNLVSDE